MFSLPSKTSFTVPVTLSQGKEIRVQTTALVDSGAYAVFISHSFVRKHRLKTNQLAKEIRVYNADGTRNKKGSIEEYAWLDVAVGDHISRQACLVTDLGGKDMFLGYSYLKKHNPEIDWDKGQWLYSRCPDTCRFTGHKAQVAQAELDEPMDEDFDEEEPWLQWIDATTPEGRVLAETCRKISAMCMVRSLEGIEGWEQLVPEQYQDFGDVFSKRASERLPVRKPYDHAVEFIDGASLPRPARNYSLSPEERNSLDEWIQENLAKGYIRPSKSPLAAPVFFVKKKDGTLRLVQDYRKLNEVIKKDRFPIPKISDLIDRLSKASIYTKIDLRWGYNNVRIKEGDEWKLAFITPFGLYEPTVMFFGLSNAPATFQRMMNHILDDLIREGHVMVYLDDILIFTNDLDHHRRLVREVLQRLRDNDLFAKPEKCFFETDSIEYLGMIISKGSVRMDPSKVDGVLSWPIPKKVKDVQAFLGFANFYRRFIRDFGKIVRPLSELTRKGKEWEWGPEQQDAFETLKKAFTSAPILKIPDDEHPFRLECDSSDFATGAVLEQLGDDGLWHPVAFYSKALGVHERNYEIYDKEMLAIIRALKEWRHHLEGHPLPFDIWSDHQNLTYFRKAQDLTRRQARWSLFLTRFHFKLEHKPGKTMKRADPMSRRPDHELGVDCDNREKVLLKPEYFAIRAMQPTHSSIVDDSKLLERIREALLDDEVTKAYKDLLLKGPREFGKDLAEWHLEDGLLLHRGKVYVPKDDKIRADLLKLHHDFPGAGHPGRWKTLELLSRNYWWPGMSVYVKKYVAGCDVCQSHKNVTQKPSGLLQPNEVPSEPWEIISCDMITDLPESDGFNAIFVVVCRLTKRAHFFAIVKEFSAKDLGNLLYERVWPLHGLPRQIISDRGSQFAAKLFQEWCRLLGIKSAMTTAFHPQADGQTERVNQSLEQYLRCYTSFRQDDWAYLLPSAEFAYNNQAHESTKNSPFYVEYGRHPRMFPEQDRVTRLAELDDWTKLRQEAQDQAKAALVLAAERMKWYYDQGHSDSLFKVGDRVWLDAKDLNLRVPSKKLAPKRVGPYEIIEQLGPVTFKLKLPKHVKIHPVFHASKLVKYVEDEVAGRTRKPPPPIRVGDEEEFEVEQIVDSAPDERGRIMYRVRWKGYDEHGDTWEYLSNLKNAMAKVKQFHKKYPDAPKAIALLQRHHSEEDEFFVRELALLQSWAPEDQFEVQLTSKDAKLPHRGSPESAGMDLFITEDLILKPHDRRLAPTGLRMCTPPGTYARVAPRSGLSLRGIDIGAGVIDRDYRGELKILLINNSPDTFTFHKGDRVAQLVLEKISYAEPTPVSNLSATIRSSEGFGSTGI